MILCGGVCIVLGIGMFVLRGNKSWQKVRSPCLVVLLFALLGFLSGIADISNAGKDMPGQITRNPPGEGVLETEAILYMPQEETEYQVSLSIEERTYRKAEETNLIAAAITEIEETFCGENASLEQIKMNPVVQDSYQKGAVAAEWLFSESDAISETGEINQQALTGKKLKVEAFVSLSCGESEEFYRFFFWIVPMGKSKEEQRILEVKEQIALQEETEAVVELPDSVDGQKVQWKTPKTSQSLELLGLGILAAIALAYVAKEQQEKQLQKRKHRLLLSYPEFVSKLSLLLGAGMTISGAMRKMNQMYQRRIVAGGRKEDVYEELYRMICEMDNGMGELRAYQSFSENCDLQPYRKLVSLLISGQKVGNRKLMEKLNEEADRVFLERKNTARRLGEEASTKMLLPMMMMLVIVMGIVIVPAFLSIYGM